MSNQNRRLWALEIFQPRQRALNHVWIPSVCGSRDPWDQRRESGLHAAFP